LHLKQQLSSSNIISVVESTHYLVLAFEYFLLHRLNLLFQQHLPLDCCLQFVDFFAATVYLLPQLLHRLILLCFYFPPELLILFQEFFFGFELLSDLLIFHFQLLNSVNSILIFPNYWLFLHGLRFQHLGLFSFFGRWSFLGLHNRTIRVYGCIRAGLLELDCTLLPTKF